MVLLLLLLVLLLLAEGGGEEIGGVYGGKCWYRLLYAMAAAEVLVRGRLGVGLCFTGYWLCRWLLRDPILFLRILVGKKYIIF